MDITQLIILGVTLIVSIALHEYAHAAASNYFGDPTPRLQGRLTPNPIKHVDPIGFLMIFLIGFGRGRPVQINPRYYKNPLRDELFVALAGPATNIALAILAILVLQIYGASTGLSQAELLTSRSLVISARTTFAFLNIALAVFNMIPLPPLDGYRLIKIRAPNLAYRAERNIMTISIVLLVILLGPGRNFIGSFIGGTAQAIFNFLFSALSLFFS